MPSRRSCSVALVLALAAAPARAVAVASGGDPIAAAADAAAKDVLASNQVPGVAVGVSVGGRTVFVRGYGFADAAKKTPVTAETRFEIGSITKQITAACVMQLVEARKLSLDDHLGTFVSDYFIGRGVTVRQLLDQQSGIPEFLAGDDAVAAAGTRPATYATLLARVSSKPLEFVPGTKWNYSNTNYLLLGRVIEVAAHDTYEHYVRTHVFEPAGMSESGFIADEPALASMARGYVPTKKSFDAAPPLRDDWATSEGAVVSTAGDVLKWDAALLSGKIVAPASVALMRASATVADGSSAGYGFGWIVSRLGNHPQIWHNGGTFGFHAVNDTFPADGESIVVLANSAVPIEGEATAIFAATHPDVASALGSSVPGERPAVTARVREWLRRIETGDIDRAQLTQRMSDFFSPEAIEQIREKFASLGAPTTLAFRGETAAGGSTVYRYAASFPSGPLVIEMTVDAAGKIDGYLLRAPE